MVNVLHTGTKGYDNFFTLIISRREYLNIYVSVPSLRVMSRTTLLIMTSGYKNREEDPWTTLTWKG